MDLVMSLWRKSSIMSSIRNPAVRNIMLMWLLPWLCLHCAGLADWENWASHRRGWRPDSFPGRAGSWMWHSHSLWKPHFWSGLVHGIPFLTSNFGCSISIDKILFGPFFVDMLFGSWEVFLVELYWRTASWRFLCCVLVDNVEVINSVIFKFACVEIF